jgi:hypothetical protein
MNKHAIELTTACMHGHVCLGVHILCVYVYVCMYVSSMYVCTYVYIYGKHT